MAGPVNRVSSSKVERPGSDPIGIAIVKLKFANV